MISKIQLGVGIIDFSLENIINKIQLGVGIIVSFLEYMISKMQLEEGIKIPSFKTNRRFPSY